MDSKNRHKKYIPLIFIGGAIPTAIVLGSYFKVPQATIIPLVLILGLIFSAMVLWTYANRQVDGSEWWQDDSASGWRGY